MKTVARLQREFLRGAKEWQCRPAEPGGRSRLRDPLIFPYGPMKRRPKPERRGLVTKKPRIVVRGFPHSCPTEHAEMGGRLVAQRGRRQLVPVGPERLALATLGNTHVERDPIQYAFRDGLAGCGSSRDRTCLTRKEFPLDGKNREVEQFDPDSRVPSRKFGSATQCAIGEFPSDPKTGICLLKTGMSFP